MGNDVNVALVAVGATVLFFGLVSRRLKRLSLNESLLSLAVGVVLGPVLGVLDPEAWGRQDALLEQVARITLAVGLTRIALQLPRGYPVKSWRSLGVLLALGMPVMWLTSSALVHLLLGLPLWEALLIGAVLTPTDPVVAASITTGNVAEENLSEDMRHLLMSESGANDGLAYPLVMLPLLFLTRPVGEALPHFFTHTLLREIAGAALIGMALGWGMGRLLLFAEARQLIERPSMLASMLAFAFFALGLTALVGANGVFAVFVAGVAFDFVVEGKQRAEEEGIVEAVDRFFTLPVFILLGLSLPWRDWLALGWKGALLVVAVLLLRRLPGWLLLKALTPQLRTRADVLYLGWFGPIGVAALYYGAHAHARTGLKTPWVIASLLICASVVVHGLSATPLTRLYGRRSSSRAGSGG